MSDDVKVSERPKLFSINLVEMGGKSVAFITHHLPDDANKKEGAMCDNFGKVMVGAYNAMIDGDVAFAEEVARVIVETARVVNAVNVASKASP
jgi:hypothetical protein